MKSIKRIYDLVELLAQQPRLWDIFEKIFGADRQKFKLYRSKVGNPRKLLDFGCSSGNVTGAFLDLNYTGIDIDSKLINHAKKKWGKHSNIKFIDLDILKPKIKIGRFDTILFAGTGHHLPDNLYLKIFREFDKYLSVGGTIHYIDTIKPSRNSPLLARWLCSIDRGKYIRTKNRYLSLISKLTKKYKVISSSEETISGALIPQPKYLYVKLKSRNKSIK